MRGGYMVQAWPPGEMGRRKTRWGSISRSRQRSYARHENPADRILRRQHSAAAHAFYGGTRDGMQNVRKCGRMTTLKFSGAALRVR